MYKASPATRTMPIKASKRWKYTPRVLQFCPSFSPIQASTQHQMNDPTNV